jgi:hypothetical protein
MRSSCLWAGVGALLLIFTAHGPLISGIHMFSIGLLPSVITYTLGWVARRICCRISVTQIRWVPPNIPIFFGFCRKTPVEIRLGLMPTQVRKRNVSQSGPCCPGRFSPVGIKCGVLRKIAKKVRGHF